MHRLLQRQISRFLDGQAAMPEGLSLFLAAVNEAYESADADRLLIEHSLELMSQELTERNTDLRTQLVERQHAEEQLENLLSLLGTTLESTADGILALDKETRAVRFNQRFVEMWGVPDEVLSFWSHDSLMQHLLGQVTDPDAFMEKLSYLCQHPEAECYDTFNCIDGRVIERYSLPQPLGVDNVGRVMSFRDITARKQAEEALRLEKEEQKALIKKLEEAHNQLLQSEKMASIGQLAAGVAHEINNPIGYINSNFRTLGEYVEKLFRVTDAYERTESALAGQALLDEIRMLKQEADWEYLKQDVRDLLRESGEGIGRVKQIVQDLKDFSHVDQAEWQWMDLHKGIDSTLNIVHSEIKYNAEVIKEFGVIPQVECLVSQLNQVFMNMLVNASHAIGDSGRGSITIRTGAEDEMVWVEFTDTGKGIPPENLKRIFDPFFTTKPVGKGTGLGLSLSYGIIEKHQGRIEVESEVGKGTTFRLRLPVSQGLPNTL
ncbi:histidine kinase [Sulfuricella sp. T08]|uniref:ATP-binding protein n=1 Tax=Sulfuricella sp. T08 TaxID=1632857 RepID=UPI0006179A2B|nr:ATP-binding protein [Sulfuricella sp. T08]GAO37391.1 histidine kinase [Sulfuricella sp. T08]